jgi:hypothetical protein
MTETETTKQEGHTATAERGGVGCSAVLDGWSLQRRPYGVGQTRGGTGDVLCYGKWGVIGGTGHYNVLFPSGWIEDRPKFKTEIEAMLWVMNKTKPCEQCGTSVEVAGDACYDATCPKQAKPSNGGTQRPGSPDGSLATETRKPGSLK